MSGTATPKQRMLNAYRGVPSDRRPIAPEFWCYFPAQVLGVPMVELEREIPFWQALQVTFKKYDTEGWGAAFPEVNHPDVQKQLAVEKISEDQYRETTTTEYRGHPFQTVKIFSDREPSWVEKYPVTKEEDLQLHLEMLLSPENIHSFAAVNRAHAAVGEDYLLEMWLGNPFFDFIAAQIGFEKAVWYFATADETTLLQYRERYIAFQKEFIRRVCAQTPFESFFIGCSYSCNSLIGPRMWRQWDRPYIQAMVDEIHRQGKLAHLHFHGKSLETSADFAAIGIDCVCPFEREPGGDVVGLDGLKTLRRLLDNRVTMNGNVQTVATLIRGNAEDARREVREIKESFEGSARLIIGSGDQIGKETPEDNLWAMIDEARK